VVDKLAGFWEWVKEFLENWRGEIAAFSAGFMGGFDVMKDIVTLHWGQAAEDLKNLPDRIGEAYDKAMRKQKQSETPLAVQQLWQLANQAGMPGVPVPEWLKGMMGGGPGQLAPGAAPLVKDQAFAGAGGDF
jgi:hypothetical protein